MEYLTLLVLTVWVVSRSYGQITSSLPDEVKCTGDDVTLNWAYTTTNEVAATWQFGTTTIMTSVAGGAPSISAAYSPRAAHGGNGVLRITGLTKADLGSYSLGVTYSAAPFSASDSVQLTVYDKITAASTPQCGTDTVTCGSSSLSGVSYNWTVDDTEVSDTSWSIPSTDGAKAYACTITGDRVTNCLDAGISPRQSATLSCKSPERQGLKVVMQRIKETKQKTHHLKQTIRNDMKNYHLLQMR